MRVCVREIKNYGKIINPFRGKQTCNLESDASSYYGNAASWRMFKVVIKSYRLLSSECGFHLYVLTRGFLKSLILSGILGKGGVFFFLFVLLLFLLCV